jgi:hypothetical protein
MSPVAQLCRDEAVMSKWVAQLWLNLHGEYC